MAYYRTCPLCGSNLDPGEKCDCESEKSKREQFYMESTRMNPITGQMAFRWDGKDVLYETKVAD